MTIGQAIEGTVLCHTVIRVAGKSHADKAPFVLVLVETDEGKNVLGSFSGPDAPAIGVRVVSPGGADELTFSTV